MFEASPPVAVFLCVGWRPQMTDRFSAKTSVSSNGENMKQVQSRMNCGFAMDKMLVRSIVQRLVWMSRTQLIDSVDIARFDELEIFQWNNESSC